MVEKHTGRMENWSKIHEFSSKIGRKLKGAISTVRASGGKPAAGHRENHSTPHVGTRAVKTCSALPAKMKTLNDLNVTAHDAVFFSN